MSIWCDIQKTKSLAQDSSFPSRALKTRLPLPFSELVLVQFGIGIPKLPKWEYRNAGSRWFHRQRFFSYKKWDGSFCFYFKCSKKPWKKSFLWYSILSGGSREDRGDQLAVRWLIYNLKKLPHFFPIFSQQGMGNGPFLPHFLKKKAGRIVP